MTCIIGVKGKIILKNRAYRGDKFKFSLSEKYTTDFSWAFCFER